MDAGRTLISDRGYHNVTADDIAAAAGVSVGSFYAYFKDKRFLFLALVDDYLDSGGVIVSGEARSFSLGTEQDVSSIIDRGIRLLLAAHRRSPGLMREILIMALADSEVKARLSEMDSRVRSFITEALIAGGIDRRKATSISFIFYHASEGVIHALAFDGQEIDEETVLVEMTRLLTVYIKDVS